MKIRFAYLSLCIAALLSIAGCKSSTPPETTILDGITQGSTYHITLLGNLKFDPQKVIDSIFLAVDNSTSVFNPDSRLSRINRGETDTMDIHIKTCIEIALGISRQSGGMYDITVKPLTSAYGFAGGTAVPKANIDSLLQYVGYEKISLEGDRLIRPEGVQIDLNSIAQGYTSDLVAAEFDRLKVKNYVVEIGGEIFCRGRNKNGEKWKIGIDRPVDGNNTPGAMMQHVLAVTGKGLATSGNYRKFYTDENGRKIVHTVNPKTGEPVISNLLSATVIAENATLADAYGTMLMVIGLDKSIEFLAAHKELDAYLVYADDNGNFKVFATEGLSDKK